MTEPFFFLIDFEQQQPRVIPFAEAAEQGIYFNILGINNIPSSFITPVKPLSLTAKPMAFSDYQQGFNLVQEQIQRGNSYLLNLTYPTKIETNYSLRDIFMLSEAPYKLYFQDRFVCFSPECFIRINNNKIYTYPMKGTIKADVPNAREQLLSCKKELWEHNTIVDLLRNDLAMVATNIEVSRFRYAELIQTARGAIWQTSSEICGDLNESWREDPISLLKTLLPAGSISGAPKEKTIAIIQQAEQQPRGFYTGIFGYFDGENLESAVIIRYIEQTEEGLQFRSGGGITRHSEVTSEYEELLAKVYIPINKR
ncbi:aminodeoxychorismate synthase component I [Gallibacterium sp. AGMB14963]|uniref:aminodeoxychorismate synthase component I n=1 Tax=Gallibacterium faecale TaxID=3019086 RepID=UPI0022F19571|nr:aminodeoxychorismate synthase component I [Gallibacterium sp. AGMB14963]MDA3979699.1 aminodeoxychorismate synthase component I [Gallibacterium sp. AGMB14963]